MTLSERDLGTNQLSRGEMLWFNAVKNFGFITTDDGERLHVHRSGFSDGAVPEGRCAGRMVSFRIATNDGRRTATNVVFVPDPNPPRARLRHGGRGRSS